MSTQLTLSESFDRQLFALEKRCREHRPYHGLLLWTPIFRRILDRLRRRDQTVQMELMQLENEIKAGKTVGALARLEQIKTMLACVLLAITLSGLGSMQPIVRGRIGSGQVRIVRVIRGNSFKGKEAA